MEPLENWRQLKRGYTFGVKTFYSDFHIGLDVLVPSWTKLYAPYDGNVVTGIGKEGGNTIYLHVAGGEYLIRFLHLAKFAKQGPVKAGDLIGYTGNTGLSTGPHLHVDVSKQQLRLYDRKNFIDPERFFNPVTLNVATVGMTEEASYQFKEKVFELSGIELALRPYDYALPTSVNQDTGYFIANTLDVPEKFLFLCPRSTLSWQMSYYYPKLNQCISVMTLNGTPASYAFELKHQLFLWYQENRGSLPALENMDWNAPTDDMIRGEFSRITPHIELFTGFRYVEQPMTEKEVAQIQALEGYSDPAGVAFWTGKPLAQYLAARLGDKLNQIQNAL